MNMSPVRRDSNLVTIPMTFESDEKGYFDRQCPNENCRQIFKVYVEDWKEKISDEEVHCPMCGHIDSADKWHTEEQMHAVIERATQFITSQVQVDLSKKLRHISNSSSKFLKVTYNPGKPITFTNNPIGSSGEWETEITCEKCGTRYSVIGSAYFCPCCGYNSAVNAFLDSLDSEEKKLQALPEMRRFMTEKFSRDDAERYYRSLLEDSMRNIVSAFHKFAASLHNELTGKGLKVTNFQIVDTGSNLFKKATGKSYSDFLESSEVDMLKIYFQRRHLIEHQGGMVDPEYLERSGDKSYELGQRLVVKERDAFLFLNIVRKLGSGLLTLRKEVHE